MRVYFAGPLFTPYERSFIDECAARLRAEGIEVFVPHENALAAGDTSAATIFEKDWNGLSEANAVVALLDGPTVDDGTACEIGIFYALMQTDSTKKGIVGLLTDLRATLGHEGHGVNLFVLGCVEAGGRSADRSTRSSRRSPSGGTSRAAGGPCRNDGCFPTDDRFRIGGHRRTARPAGVDRARTAGRFPFVDRRPSAAPPYRVLKGAAPRQSTG